MIVNPSPSEAHCTVEFEHDDTASTYYWQTGSATGFRLAVTKLRESLVLVAWLWKGEGVAGPAMVFDLLEESYDAHYVELKMDIKAADAVAICQFMRHLYPEFQFRA